MSAKLFDGFSFMSMSPLFYCHFVYLVVEVVWLLHLTITVYVQWLFLGEVYSVGKVAWLLQLTMPTSKF